MGASVYLLMAIHAHQPVGNFDFVFEKAFRSAYEPFLSILERHPAIHVTLHYSGSLLDWLAAHQPRFLSRLKRLVRQGQVELLASGYYEPILSLIPEADRQGQIALMQRTLRQRFGATARGLWLTERVWEPELPQTLARCGIRYTLLDTNQFRVARDVLPGTLQVEEDSWWDVLGCYVTEYAGESVVLFPSSKRLRYWMPFQEVSRTIEFLRRVARPQPLAITYADDAEKFGLWPKTYAWVYEQGWLERFCCALEQESSWLKTATFSRYLDEVGPSGQAYLPCGSYEEMLEWSRGYFRNFFVKYPEANAMRQKMLDISQQLQRVQRSAVKGPRSNNRPSNVRQSSERITRNSKRLARAQQELYKAQCNDAYWHGVFGGLYLAPLRRAVYHHLITAEQLLQEAQGLTWTHERRDLDGDGRQELRVRTPTLGLVIDPAEDGTVTELAYYPKAVNLVDTLARRYEPYHEKLKTTQLSEANRHRETPASIHDLLNVKEEGLEARLAYDSHRRSWFIDHALSAMPTPQDLWRATHREHQLWSGGAWEVQQAPGRARPSRGTTVTLLRRIQDGRLQKTVSVPGKEPRLVFRYQVSDVEIPVVGLEFNLGLLDARFAQPERQESVASLQVRDPTLGIAVTVVADPPASLISFPIETVSESEEGLERTPQGLALVWLWPTRAARHWSCELAWNIEDLPAPRPAQRNQGRAGSRVTRQAGR